MIIEYENINNVDFYAVMKFFPLDPDPAQLRKKNPAPDPALIGSEEKIYLYFR